MQISYIDLNNAVQKHSGLVRVLALFDKAITYATVLLYACLLLYGVYTGVPTLDFTCLYRSLLVTGVAFVLVSIFRKKYKAQRPYELYNYRPALKKDTKGKSFPSRHVFSIFMVAMTYLWVSLPIAILLFVMGLALAAIRVIGGVHFIRDVVAGMAIAIIVGLVSYGFLGSYLGLLVLRF